MMVLEYRGFTIETNYSIAEGYTATVRSRGNIIQSFIGVLRPTSTKKEGEAICIERAKVAINKIIDQ